MKFKLILFSLIITSLFLVSAFESPEWNIGIGVPSGEQGDIEVEITEPGIEITITNETDNLNTKTYNPSGGGKNPGTYFPDVSSGLDTTFNSIDLINLTGDSIPLDTTGDEKNNLDSEEKEQDEKGFVSRITGAVIGTVGTTGAIAIPVFVFGIIGAVVFFKFRRK